MPLTLTRGRWPSPCPQKHNNTPHYNACLPAHTPVSQRTALTLPLTFTYLHPQPSPSQYNSSHASTRAPTRVSSWGTEAREWGGRHHGRHASRRSIGPHGVGQGWVRCIVAASSRWRLQNIPHTTVVSYGLKITYTIICQFTRTNVPVTADEVVDCMTMSPLWEAGPDPILP